MVTSGRTDTNPAVAMDRGSGNFIVAYQRGSVVHANELSFNGTRRTGSPLLVGIGSSFARPALSIDGADQYLMTFTTLDRSNDRGSGIYGGFGRVVFPPPTR